jgi:hypothetical protein
MRQRTPIEDRFWPRVRKTETCWIWTGNTDSLGYGRISAGGKYGPIKLVHRVAYEMVVGPIPEGCHLDHLCQNTSCVNPAHLEAITPGEHVDRSFKRRGQKRGPAVLKTHCPKGHPLSGDNLYVPPGTRLRQCRECGRTRSREFQRRKRADLSLHSED